MIEEVVSSILEAEDRAKNRIAEAEQKASNIIAEAESNAEVKKHRAMEQNKEFLQQSAISVEAEVKSVAQQSLQQLNEQADSELEKCNANVDKAVDVILEFIK